MAYKRRFLEGGSRWRYQNTVDGTAQLLISEYGLDPEKIECAADMAANYERRIKFQADVQDYVDMAISSTINLPPWGTEHNNEDKVKEFAATLSKYAPRLRGFTAYPDGSRGGQPLTSIPYAEAIKDTETIHEDNEACRGGVCGI